MTVQVVPSNFENSYPRRGDRLREEPSAKNAQGLFSPDACIFVGNLSTKVCADDLAEDLKKVFAEFGPCHVKIKQDKKKGLPGAFVQFEKVEDASAALANDERVVLHDRWLRIERAKGRRTACLGLRTGAHIGPHDVTFALGGRGPLEVWCIEPHLIGSQTWTSVGKVTFAYVDDCRDAIKYFQKDENYYLCLLDMDGSPMLPASGQFVPLHSKVPGLFPPGRNNNGYRHTNGSKPSRNVPNRGNYRGGGPKNFRRNLQQQENFSALHLQGIYPGPPIWMGGIPYNHEVNQPSYPSPLLTHPNNGHGSPPFIVDGQPGFDHLHIPLLPGAYVPTGPGGPFIVSSQSPYDGNPSAIYHDPFTPESGFLSPPSSNASQQGGSHMQQAYNESFPPKSEYLAPPYKQAKVTTPHPVIEKNNGSSKGNKIIEELLDTKRQEKPPKLIPVCKSDERVEGGKSCIERAEFQNASVPEPINNPVKETEETGRSEVAAGDGNEIRTDDSVPTAKSDKCNSGQLQQQCLDSAHNSALARDLNSVSTPSSSRSRSCSLPSTIDYLVPSSPLNKNCPISPFKAGKTIEEYVRYTAEQQKTDLSEDAIQDIIKSLEAEQKDNMKSTEIKGKTSVDSRSGRSRSRLLTRTSSSSGFK